ncbi:MAG: cytidylate kinase-like family protein [Bacteroidaceae bacterium]|nr:cytidylate kinase-like family protein [Bacteroidaceae bacterium]
MRKIITIAREYGAGGRTIGKRVAKELDLAFYDRDLVLKTAEVNNALTPEDVRAYEEKVSKVGGVAQSLFDFYSRPLSDQIWEAQIEAIRGIADKESCVIVGRNADYILREFDHVLKVFCFADRDWKIQHMLELHPDQTFTNIENEMIKADKARQTYCSKYTGQVYGLSTNYDLCLNVGKLGIDRAVEMILSAAKEV